MRKSNSERSKKIRRQIIKDVIHHPKDIVNHIAELFDITQQAVALHIEYLIEQNMLVSGGSKTSKIYTLGNVRENEIEIQITPTIDEHAIFMRQFHWVIDDLPKNINDIIHYGFTEMVNNAKDHSEGNFIHIAMKRSNEKVTVSVSDDGEGIFKRITRLKGLIDERQSIIELSKGKLTTDPQNHSGEGIFFTSRVFDLFFILSRELSFSHDREIEFDRVDDTQNHGDKGTIVHMSIATDSMNDMKNIFDEFSGSEEEDYLFNKTLIPVRLAKFGNENLVSRSQAKRLLTRIENFKYVIFDFQGVDMVGQAFADEIFRVYQNANPEIDIKYVNTNSDIEAWIKRVKNSVS